MNGTCCSRSRSLPLPQGPTFRPPPGSRRNGVEHSDARGRAASSSLASPSASAAPLPAPQLLLSGDDVRARRRNERAKPPGANPETPSAGNSSKQEEWLPSSQECSIRSSPPDRPITKEKEQQVKDVSSEKRGHDKSADGISLQGRRPTSEHAHEAAATAATAASSKPSSVQKKETVGPQANPRRTDQEERRVSTMEPTREAAAEHSQFSSVDGIGSQANPGRINQDQGRRVSTKGPGEAMHYRFPSADGVRSEASPIPRKEDQPRRNSQIY
ncbi:serine/arginine repetitive matrix protein 2-like [Ananas comosus]|uniref:Serine/arginine repetitive matrix protein 2-like n=1 Tax=Ananas comosus TaxID=4615 RepID=A0A6P5FVI8_ANACO|nr:serine/arginine repetitive matrix protein 2-like [Ananas comosus]